MKCEICGADFVPYRCNQKYCSAKCRRKHFQLAKLAKRKIIKAKKPAEVKKLASSKCHICGKLFYPSYRGQKYCSDSCRFNPRAVRLRNFLGAILTFRDGKFSLSRW